MTQKCDIIKVNIDDNVISVYNNGDSIPIEIHEKENIYIPEMIFGHLLTSSNYDDSQKRIAGGRNGYGAKLTNIFSKQFIIEIVNNNKKYVQIFENNLSVINKPKITKCTTKKDYTKVTFLLDFEKFEMKSLTKDYISLIEKRTYDIAATIPSFSGKSKSMLSDKLIPFHTFDKYMQFYYPTEKKFMRQ